MENEMKIDKELFAPLSAEEKKVSVAVRPSVGYWKDAWTRLKKDKMALKPARRFFFKNSPRPNNLRPPDDCGILLGF